MLSSFKYIAITVLMFAAVKFTQAQDYSNYSTLPSGIKYKIHTENKGKKPEMGQLATVHLHYTTADGEVIFTTYDKEAVPVMIKEPAFNGDFMEGIPLMAEGDSATFLSPTDSIATFTPLPPNIKLGTYFRYDVKLVKVYTHQEWQEKQHKDKANNPQLKADTMAIAKYLRAKNIQAHRTPSGLYYVLENEGTGEQASAGKEVDVHYTGMFMDGKVFDSSRDRGVPFSFTLGRGEVIQGWDEGIALLSEGQKATFYIPSPLAYGERAMGPIPAHSVLMFEVELIDVK